MTNAGRSGDGASDGGTVTPADRASTTVLINGRGALRVGDGNGRWVVGSGAPAVFINGKPATRKGDDTQHPDGGGQLHGGSQDVLIGNGGGGGRLRPVLRVQVLTRKGTPMAHQQVEVLKRDGTFIGRYTLDESGMLVARIGIEWSAYVVRLPDGRMLGVAR